MGLLFAIGVIIALILIMFIWGEPKDKGPKKKGKHR